jgi:AcrR family transcriptional regulator
VRTAVLSATTDLLTEQGFEGLSIPDVAVRAGVHDTSVYRRWGSKANLVADALLSLERERIPQPDTGTLRGDLIELMRSVAAFLGSPLGTVLLQLAVRHDLPELDTVRGDFWNARLAFGAAILERARDRGEVRDGIDHRVFLETIIAPVHLRRLVTGEPLDDRFFAGVVDLVLPSVTSASA